MVVVRTVADWTKQVRDALDEIKAANGGEDPPSLRASAAIAPQAFTKLIEALVALEPYTRKQVDQELINLAGLKPVDQVLGG